MPYLPLELDGKKAAAKAARAVGMSPGDILWGLADLWEHVFVTKADTHEALVIDGCFGARQGLRDALVAFGFIRPTPDGRFYVCGSERILGAADQRAGAGKARVASARRDAKGRLISRSSECPAEGPAGPAESSAHPAAAGRATSGRSSESPALKPSTQHPTPDQKKPADFGVEQASATQVPATTTQGVTEQAVKSSVPSEAVATVERLYRDATGSDFAWGMPNGPEERALRALAARHSDAELPALLRAAFEPSYPSYASLARLDRGGAGAVNELRAKAKRLATTGPPAKGRASNADKDWDGAAVKTITTQHGEEWTFDDEHR